MTLQNRFHFLNLWDEAADQGEDDKLGPVREQQSISAGASQGSSESSGQGKCSRSLLASRRPRQLKEKHLRSFELLVSSSTCFILQGAANTAVQ